MPKKPLVTISIATLNSGDTISKTLETIRQQSYKNIEIIVGDGGSKDDTVNIVKKYGATICFGKELGRARYEILQHAKGKYLMIIDSDQYIGKTLIARAVKIMEKENYDGLIFNEESVINKNSTFIERLLAYDKWVVATSRDKTSLWGAEFPRMFKTKDLKTFRWQKTLSLLDDQILVQQNLSKLKKIGYLDGDGIMHKEVDKFSVFFSKFMKYGKMYEEAFKISKKTAIAHSLPRKNFFKLRVIKRPNVFLGVLLLYSLKAIAVTWGIIYYKIFGR